MPLKSTDLNNIPVCSGSSWTEQTRSKLIENIGELLCGLYLRVLNRFRGLATSTAPKYQNKYALNKLQNSSTDHRDGWLFQMISFLCLMQKHGSDKSVYIAHPHIQPADKGFDNLLLKIDLGKKEVEYIMVTEDKATKSPRKVFKQDVLPEFESIENDERTSQLIICTSALLKNSSLSEEEIEKEIARFFWEPDAPKTDSRLRYRVNLTVKPKAKYNKMFKDFDSVINGDISRRKGEMFLVEDLRPWMQQLSDDVITYINK